MFDSDQEFLLKNNKNCIASFFILFEQNIFDIANFLLFCCATFTTRINRNPDRKDFLMVSANVAHPMLDRRVQAACSPIAMFRSDVATPNSCICVNILPETFH